jgi:hypothetical protein
MNATSLDSPQTLNLYAYCSNDPVNYLDPSGLGFLSFLKKLFKVVLTIVLVAAAVVAAFVGVLAIAGALLPFMGAGAGWALVGLSALGFMQAFGPPWLQKAISIGLTAVGIYFRPPAIIWNFAQTAGTSRALTRAIEFFGTVGAISSFLGQHSPGKSSGDNRPKGGKTPPDPCTKQFKTFFANSDLYKEVADSLQTDVDFVMAQSSWESGWNGQHAQDLHNLFGLTKGGGRNLRFSTYKEGANVYVKTVGPYVTGAKTMEEYVAGLQKAGYNAKASYYDTIKNQLDVLRKHEADCRK